MMFIASKSWKRHIHQLLVAPKSTPRIKNEFNMKEFYEKKYSKYVTNILIDDDMKILRNNVSNVGENHQNEIISHLSQLTKSDSSKLIKSELMENDIEWGFDCSGWLGSLINGKEIFIIGTEPNIDRDFKIAPASATVKSK